jgi:hypothetical protein
MSANARRWDGTAEARIVSMSLSEGISRMLFSAALSRGNAGGQAHEVAAACGETQHGSKDDLHVVSGGACAVVLGEREVELGGRGSVDLGDGEFAEGREEVAVEDERVASAGGHLEVGQHEGGVERYSLTTSEKVFVGRAGVLDGGGEPAGDAAGGVGTSSSGAYGVPKRAKFRRTRFSSARAPGSVWTWASLRYLARCPSFVL